MSIKLTHFIELFRVEQGTDEDGFPVERDELLVSVRAYREDRYGSEMWKNRSLFSKATVLFRIRSIPGITLDTRCVVVTEDGSLSAQFEHTILVTPDGCEVLTQPELALSLEIAC